MRASRGHGQSTEEFDSDLNLKHALSRMVILSDLKFDFIF